jgi:hypothetical protein
MVTAFQPSGTDNRRWLPNRLISGRPADIVGYTQTARLVRR